MMTTTTTSPYEQYVETFEGFRVFQDEHGFNWMYGGYFDTLEDCREDIYLMTHTPSSWR